MNNQQPEIKHRQITENRLQPLILRFAAPTTVGMLVIALYSLADAYFVSALGTEASAAVGVSFSIQVLLQAVGYTLGMGAGSLISRSLGKKEPHIACVYARVSFWLSLIIGTLIAGIGIAFGGAIIRFLGATDSIYKEAMSYARFLFLSSPFMCATFVLSQLLRAEGKTVYSMAGLAGGSFLNIVLDCLFINKTEMGIAGASLATLISQIVSTLILVSAYILKQSQLSLFVRPKIQNLKKAGTVITNGLPSAARQGLTTLATILLNRAAGQWGDAALAAITIVVRLFLLAFSVCLGIGQGMMPIIGYNYGCRKTDRVRFTYRFSVLLSTASMLLIGIVMFVWAPAFIALFRNDAEVIAIGAVALRAQSTVMALHGVITCTIMLLQAIGKQVPATLLACARQGIFFLPLIFVLPYCFGVKSVIYVQPIADALTFLFALFFVVYISKLLKQKHSERSPKNGRQAE